MPFVIIDILRLIFAERLESILDSITFNVLDMSIKSLVFAIPLIYIMHVHR